MAKLHELLERRAHVVSEMREINTKAEAEKREYIEAEDTKHKSLKAELADLDKKIERARDLAEAERRLDGEIISGSGDGKFDDELRKFSIRKAILSQMPG